MWDAIHSRLLAVGGEVAGAATVTTTDSLLVRLASPRRHHVLVGRHRRPTPGNILHTVDKRRRLRSVPLAGATRGQHRGIVRLVGVEHFGRVSVGQIVRGVDLTVGHAGVDEAVGRRWGHEAHVVGACGSLVDCTVGRPHQRVAVLVAGRHGWRLLGARWTRARRHSVVVVRVGGQGESRWSRGATRGRRWLRRGERDRWVRHGTVEPCRSAVNNSVIAARAARRVIHHVRRAGPNRWLRRTARGNTLQLVRDARLRWCHLKTVRTRWRHVRCDHVRVDRRMIDDRLPRLAAVRWRHGDAHRSGDGVGRVRTSTSSQYDIAYHLALRNVCCQTRPCSAATYDRAPTQCGRLRRVAAHLSRVSRRAQHVRRRRGHSTRWEHSRGYVRLTERVRLDGGRAERSHTRRERQHGRHVRSSIHRSAVYEGVARHLRRWPHQQRHVVRRSRRAGWSRRDERHGEATSARKVAGWRVHRRNHCTHLVQVVIRVRPRPRVSLRNGLRLRPYVTPQTIDIEVYTA